MERLVRKSQIREDMSLWIKGPFIYYLDYKGIYCGPARVKYQGDMKKSIAIQLPTTIEFEKSLSLIRYNSFAFSMRELKKSNTYIVDDNDE